ncbi:FAD-binding protein [Promicromonospora panici]|uniref:FAD-binding protein n=1 Tax=Promicromonospora panici TaxID=2219658 RepID=UPI00101CDE8E|nr:FAD-binding protein [Promicromonospora panici]
MPSREHRLATSVLVVGTGGAGLRAAIELTEAGTAVLAVGKRPAVDAHTVLATDGISAALATADPDDTWEQHAADTLHESGLLADPRAVQHVARNAGQAIHDLERFGMRFDRQADGRIDQRGFGAHTYRRTAFTGDHTGLRLQRVLRAHAARLGVPLLSTCYVTRLLVDGGSVFGAYGFDLVDGSRYLIHADAVILAAGGHTRIWRRAAARRDESTGDSFRLAAEAGVRLRDPELVQFHPTGLLAPENAAGTLVGEAARREGGGLLNNLGERFLDRYDPVRMERAGRDLVARASYTEIAEGRGTPAGGVWLDLSHLPRETILTRLPDVYRTLLDLQMVDVTCDPFEVAPTAYYSMGGAQVRPEDNGTDVDGLYVVGEAASGLHGANHVEGNALLELLVHGRSAARAAALYSARLTNQRRSLGAVRDAEADVDRVLTAGGRQNPRALQREVRDLVTEHAGVVRHEAGLRAGLTRLEDVEDRAGDLYVHTDISGYQDLAHAFDLRSAALAARATLECALERRESRGSHQRSDHPGPDPALRVNLLWSPTEGVRRAVVPPVPTDIAALMRDVPADGKWLE